MDKSEYKEYVAQLNGAYKRLVDGSVPKLLVVHGANPYLVEKTFVFLRDVLVQKLAFEWTPIDSEVSSIENFEEHFLQKGLFDVQTAYALRNLDKKSVWFKRIASEYSKFQKIVLLITIADDRLPNELVKLEGKDGFLSLRCAEPARHELPKFLISMADRYKIKLDPQATDLLVQAYSKRLFEVENIFKIAAASQDGVQVLDSLRILEIVGAVADDRVFEFFKYLRAKQLSKANGFIKNLLDIGESPLAILGMFTKFLRDEIQNPRRSFPNSAIYSAFEESLSADIALKSTRQLDFNLLSSAVGMLEKHS